MIRQPSRKWHTAVIYTSLTLYSYYGFKEESGRLIASEPSIYPLDEEEWPLQFYLLPPVLFYMANGRLYLIQSGDTMPTDLGPIRLLFREDWSPTVSNYMADNLVNHNSTQWIGAVDNIPAGAEPSESSAYWKVYIKPLAGVDASNIVGVVPVDKGGTGNNTASVPADQLSGVVPIVKGGTENTIGLAQDSNAWVGSAKTISTAAPSGGATNQIWFRYTT